MLFVRVHLRVFLCVYLWMRVHLRVYLRVFVSLHACLNLLVFISHTSFDFVDFCTPKNPNRKVTNLATHKTLVKQSLHRNLTDGERSHQMFLFFLERKKVFKEETSPRLIASTLHSIFRRKCSRHAESRQRKTMNDALSIVLLI